MAKKKTAKKKTTPAPPAKSSAADKVRELVRKKDEEIARLNAEVNKLTAIPRTSEGETYPLGNAPTPVPE
jgi:hypothetical protein